MPLIDIQGFCPACGEKKLHIHSDVGMVHCLNPECPDQSAAGKILADPEIHHLVTFKDNHYNLKHPLRERIGDKLLDCTVSRWLFSMQMKHGPQPDATHRIIEVDGKLITEPVT